MRTKIVLSQSDPFDNKRWRTMVQGICTELDKTNIGIEAISPFGFEVLGNKKFLSKNLKRFYCYIGIPQQKKISKQTELKLIKQFSETLFHSIGTHFPELKTSFILKILQDEFIKLRPNSYIPKDSDKLLDIQVRYVNTEILDDYADYIITTLSALHNEKDEAKFFMNNTRFRSRTFQLYIMQECLYKDYLPHMNEHELLLHKMIFSKIKNNVDIFYNENKLNIPADEAEMQIMQELVKPRLKLMMNEAKNHSDVFKLQSESYHVADTLSLDIGKGMYKDIKEKIKKSYLSFQ